MVSLFTVLRWESVTQRFGKLNWEVPNQNWGTLKETTEELVVVSTSLRVGEIGQPLVLVLLPVTPSLAYPCTLTYWVISHYHLIFRFWPAAGAVAFEMCMLSILLPTAFLLLWLNCIRTFLNLMKFSVFWEALLSVYSEKPYCGQVPRSTTSHAIGSGAAAPQLPLIGLGR